MTKGWKKGAALVIAAAMCAGALSGCSKKTEAVAAFTLNGEKVDGDFTNFVLRYEQSTVDDIYAYYAEMMQQDVWSMDDGQGMGITTWDNFKAQIGETIEKLLLAEAHASDYGVELTDDEKKEITETASAFLAANDEETLASMSATQETVERYLTLMKIQNKVELGMVADVDTNVSDEEAAQRTVSYIQYTPSTEAQTEAVTEAAADQTEAEISAVMTEAETVYEIETEADVVSETVMTEAETSAVETEEQMKTQSSDETEAVSSTEAEAVQSEAAIEPQSEAADLAMAEAKVRYREMAQTQLDAIMNGNIDFATACENVTNEAVTGVTTSSFTFGKDDTYPDAAIIEATNDLADGTLVKEVVEASDSSYYILHVDLAFDEEATEEKKEEIVDQRKTDKVNEVYTQWMGEATFETDSEVLSALLKERSYTAPEEADTESSEDTLVLETEAGDALVLETEAEDALVLETEAEDSLVLETEAENTADDVQAEASETVQDTEVMTETEA